MAKNPLYLIGMKVTNFLKVENFDYQFDGKSVKLAGPNASGKTTLLRAIWAACLGKAQIPSDVINNGKDKAEIEIDLGQYIVKRTITKKDAYLTITNAEGFKAGNPQTILDGLVGQIALDPHAFMETDAKRQAEQAGVIFGVSQDLDKVDAAIKQIFEERTYVNRKCKDLQAKLTGTKPEVEDLKPVDLDQLRATEAQYAELDLEYREVRSNLDHHRHVGNGLDSKIALLERQLEEAKKEQQEEFKAIVLTEKKLEHVTAKASELPARDDLKKQIEEGRETNLKIERQSIALQAWEDQAKELDEADEKSTELSAAIDKLRVQRQATIAGAKIPVDGLGFEDGVLTYNDHPLSNASHAEQLRVATAILMAQDPSLKLLTIKDASLMDNASWAVVEELAKEHKFQVLYEIVSDDASQAGIFIEDGIVTHVDGKKVEPKPVETVEEKAVPKAAPRTKTAPRTKAEADAIEADADREMGDERGLFDDRD